AFTSTLLQRYELERVGQFARDYALDTSNWDARFLTMAGIAGGAVMYLNGLQADARLGDVNLGVHLAPAMQIRSSFQNGGSASRFASVELGLKDTPITLASSWDLDRGNICNNRVSLQYQVRI